MTYPSSDSQISYKDYESFTGFTLGKMLDEYKMFVVDLHNSQLNTIKTYLWLSVVIIGAICSALMTTDFHFETITGGQAISISTLLFSCFLSLKTFVSGTRLLLGERGGAIPLMTDSYFGLLESAYGDDGTWTTHQTRQDWIEDLEQKIDYLRDIYNEKGVKIRRLNTNLVCSVYLGSIGALILFFCK